MVAATTVSTLAAALRHRSRCRRGQDKRRRVGLWLMLVVVSMVELVAAALGARGALAPDAAAVLLLDVMVAVPGGGAIVELRDAQQLLARG